MRATAANSSSATTSRLGRSARAARYTAVAMVAAVVALAGPADANERIANPVAVFAALDKVTARISTMEVQLEKTVRFGSLKVTPHTCYSSAPTETPRTTGFVTVDEVRLEGNEQRIFSGWMFAESPGINAVEHPVFDVWLTGCKGGAAQAALAPRGETAGQAPAEPEPRTRRRVRR